MKHHYLKGILLCLCMFTSINTFAYDAEIDGIYYSFNFYDDEAEVTSGDTYYSGDVTIPEYVTYNSITYSVTSIGYNAFYDCYGLTSVTIPNSVTSIGDNAFCGCQDLKQVILPNNLGSIGSYAFEGCRINWLDIPEGVTELGESSLAGINFVFVNWETPISLPHLVNTSEATTLYVPHGCKEAYQAAENWNASFSKIVDNVFKANTAGDVPMLFKIIDEEGKKCVVEGLHPIFTNYSGPITIPTEVNGYEVTAIEDYAFSRCEITSVDIHNHITSIGNYAFSNCANLERVIAHWSNYSLLESIGDYAFNSCQKLSSCDYLIKTNSLVSIGDFAFGYTNLTGQLEIGSRVSHLGYAPFVGCNNITSVIGNGWYNSYCQVLTERSTNKLIEYFPFSTGIPSGVKTIGRFAFPALDITLFDIPEGVECIESNAFEECYKLSSVSLPVSLIEMGTHPFNWCKNLNTITFKNRKPIDMDPYTRLSETIYVPKGTKRAYLASENWSRFANNLVEYEYNNVDAITVNLSANGIATYSSLYNLDFTDVSGLKAYVASGFNPVTGELLLTRVYDVPGCEGLLLKGEAGSYNIPVNNSDMFYSNLMKGVPVSKAVAPTDGDYTNFILANGQNGIGFYPLVSEGEMAEGKAYLQIPTSIAPVAEAKSLRLIFEDDDEITSIENVGISEKPKLVYDLQGRKVEHPTKGTYIVNGKKIIIK